MLLCRLWHVVTHVLRCLRLARANLPISSPVQTLDFPPCVNSFQFREGNVEIRSVPSSGRPGAQLGHHILVRHWLIFTFDSDRNGTGIIFRKSIGYFLGVDINCIIATHFILYVVYAYIYIFTYSIYSYIVWLFDVCKLCKYHIYLRHMSL